MSSVVCCYYNPYFSDGCSRGKRCEFKHLSLSEYGSFVESCAQNEMSSRSPKNGKAKSKSAAYYGFKSAMKKFNEHRYSLSSSILKSLLHDSPHNPRYNLWCARSMEKLNLFESAESYYRRAIATQPHNATFHGRYAALLHFKLNRLEEAKSHYEIALELRDDINAVHCHYGKLLCDLAEADGYQSYHRAEYHFKKCLQLFENDEECHFYFGELLYKTGDLVAAEYHIKHALYLQNKPYLWHYYYYALICIELEKYCDAKQHLQICLDLHFAFKYAMWHKIYLEYGLLLIFVFNSLDTGLKYINQHANTSTHHYMTKDMKQELIKDASSNSNLSIHHYKKWRNILKHINNEPMPPSMATPAISVSPPTDSIISNELDLASISNESPSNSNSISNESPSPQLDESAMRFFLSNNEFEAKEPSEPSEDSEEEHQDKRTECSVQNEFYRFLGNIGCCEYYFKFEAAKIDDIRLIEHIDASFLEKSIGMNSAQVKSWSSYLNDEWKKECDYLSRKWKMRDRFLYTLFYDVFAEHGVMTLESFHYYFKKPNDIKYLVENNTQHAQSIWRLFQDISHH